MRSAVLSALLTAQPGLKLRAQVDLATSSPLIVAWDHDGKFWRAYQWAPASTAYPAQPAALKDAPTRFDDMGTLRFDAPSSQRVLLVVTRTNPLLYSIEKLPTVYETSPDLANLRAILDGLASFITASVKHGDSHVEIKAATGPQGAPLCQYRLPAVPPTKALNDALMKVRTHVALLSAHKLNAVSQLRRGEAGEEVAFAIPDDPLSDTDRYFSALDEARENFATSLFGKAYSCPGLRQLADAELTYLLTHPSESDAAKHWKDAIAKAQTVRCPYSESLDNFTSGLTGTIVSCATKFLTAYVQRSDDTQEVLTRSAEALTQRSAVETASLALLGFKRVVDEVIPKNKSCSLRNGVLVAYNADRAFLDKLATVKFKIQPVSPFGETYERLHETNVEHSFVLRESHAGHIGYGVGLVLTGIKQPTWEAVQDPRDATKKVIARTKETSRSGDLALLLAYRFLDSEKYTFNPGLHVGVGTTNDLAGFLGVSLDLGRYARIGVGFTSQQVNRLIANQHELRYKPDGTPDPASLTSVTATSDIQMRTEFRNAAYGTISLSLDGLPLFTKK
ncbi:MAG TPA: hypothetical protein VGS96_01675 [Thermoanaerobaculia bacterium]|nr:hypothetical protein [Thermoanaerobaculia bacterium]